MLSMLPLVNEQYCKVKVVWPSLENWEMVTFVLTCIHTGYATFNLRPKIVIRGRICGKECEVLVKDFFEGQCNKFEWMGPKKHT